MASGNQSKGTKNEITTKENKQNKSVIMQSLEYSGPLPTPNMLAGYDDILPGAADRIITMTEKQASHRQEKEMFKVKTEARDSLLGIISATILCLFIVVCGTTIALVVRNSAAVISGSMLDFAGIASIVGTFLKGTSNSWKQSDGKENKE